MFTSEGQTGADPIAESITEAFKRHVAPDVPVRRGDRADGDQDAEAQFYVLRKTVAPAVLGEVGFFTNINDALSMALDHSDRISVVGPYFCSIFGLPFGHLQFRRQ